MREGNALEKRPPQKSHLEFSKVGENAIGDFISHFSLIVKWLLEKSKGLLPLLSPLTDATPRGLIPWTGNNSDGARVNRLRTCPWLVATLRRYPGNPYEK